MTTPYVKTPFTASMDDIVMLYDGTASAEPWPAHVLRVVVTEESQWVDVISELLGGGTVLAYRFRVRGPGASPQDAPQQAVPPVETGPGENYIDVSAHRIYTVGASANAVNGTWMVIGQNIRADDLPNLP